MVLVVSDVFGWIPPPLGGREGGGMGGWVVLFLWLAFLFRLLLTVELLLRVCLSLLRRCFLLFFVVVFRLFQQGMAGGGRWGGGEKERRGRGHGGF